MTSNMTGFVSTNVTSITDSKTVDSLNTATNGYWVSLDNGAVSKTVSNLTGIQTKQLTSLTNGGTTIAITNLVNGSGSSKSIATATAANHGLVAGNSVTISGASVAAFNGTFIVSSATTNSFTYTLTATPTPGNNTNAGGSPVITTITSVVTATLANHGFQDGQSVTITGVVPSSYNGTYTISAIGANAANQFTFTIPNGLGPITDATNVFAAGNTTTATATVTQDCQDAQKLASGQKSAKPIETA